MDKVLIAQTAAVSALGDSLHQTWDNLCAGKSALSPVRRFPIHKFNGNEAACIPSLDNTDDNKVILLLKKLIPQLHPLHEDTLFIWTGIKGGADKIQSNKSTESGTGLQYGSEYRQFLLTELKLHSDGLEINAACAASTVGICIGANMIRQGAVDSVLVVGADWVSRFTFSGFSALNASSKTTCKPFDKSRDGLALGDGAAAIHLISGKHAAKMAIKPVAVIKGWAITNDAFHITRPATDGRGLSAAITIAINHARLNPADIKAFCAHGTGTVYNDAMELAAISTIFQDRRFPLFSVKGALGHTLGAAGAIETAICIKALQNRQIPPTHNLSDPEDRAIGCAANQIQSFASGPILTTNSGFGGINAALIIGDR